MVLFKDIGRIVFFFLQEMVPCYWRVTKISKHLIASLAGWKATGQLLDFYPYVGSSCREFLVAVVSSLLRLLHQIVFFFFKV